MIKTEISKFIHLLKEENDYKAHLVFKIGGELTPEQVVSMREDMEATVAYFETKYKNNEVGEVLPPFQDYMELGYTDDGLSSDELPF